MAYCILPFLLPSPSSLLKLTLFQGVRGKGAYLGVPLFELNMALFLWTGGYQWTSPPPWGCLHAQECKVSVFHRSFVYLFLHCCQGCKINDPFFLFWGCLAILKSRFSLSCASTLRRSLFQLMLFFLGQARWVVWVIPLLLAVANY